MSKIWFVYSSDIVSGPFSTEEVKSQLSLGKWTSNSFIWWKGQREWMPVRVWESQLPKILKNESEKTQSPVWYVDIGGAPVGPLTQKEMIDNLRGVTNLNKVRLWTVGMNKWTNLFELHEIMDQLGISRREHERAPLMGTVIVTRGPDDPKPMITKAASVSIGGMGLNDAGFLTKGDEVHLLIKSPEFPAPIRVRATTVYVTQQGYAGLKFISLHPETQSFIFDYVRKFNGPQSVSKSA